MGLIRLISYHSALQMLIFATSALQIRKDGREGADGGDWTAVIAFILDTLLSYQAVFYRHLKCKGLLV